jgi:plastocyanin
MLTPNTLTPAHPRERGKARAGNGPARLLTAVAGASVLFYAGLVGAQQLAAAATAPNEVVIDDFAFGPASLIVAPGTKVTWTNRDNEPHTVVSTEKPAQFKSGALDSDDKFDFTFAQPGTYRYFCSIHPQMVGTVVVK